MGILAALLESQKSGKGQVIDAAITDDSAHLMSMFYTMDKLRAFQTKRASNMLDGGVPYYDSYETKDGKFLSVAPIEPQFFAEMVKLAKLPESLILNQNNPQEWSNIKVTMSATFKEKTQNEWVTIFEESDACVAGILDFKEATSHSHNIARQSYVDVAGQMQPAPALDLAVVNAQHRFRHQTREPIPKKFYQDGLCC